MLLMACLVLVLVLVLIIVTVLNWRLIHQHRQLLNEANVQTGLQTQVDEL